MAMPLYLGLDSSTQSLSAVVIDLDARAILLDHSISFDKRLREFGTKNGVLPNKDPLVAHSDPLMWVGALDLMCEDLIKKGIDLSQVAAIAGSGQQHGSVCLNAKAAGILKSLNPRRPLAKQLKPALSRPTSAIWMDSSTRAQCDEIEAAAGGKSAVAELTGSSCFERFTGPQIRKFAQKEKRRYEKTSKTHLVSSFMASVLAGRHAPIDHGDGMGMNLMDIYKFEWSPLMLKATAPGLRKKLPRLARSDSVVGRISPYFVQKYAFSPKCRVAAWSGDNPNSLIGVGLISTGKACISLGTSDTYFAFMPQPHVSREGEGHVFGSPTGHYMGLICFLNGSLAREKVKDAYGLSWDGFSQALKRTKPGNGGKVMLPYFSPEVTPNVLDPHVHRYGLKESEVRASVRAVVEAQMASMALHTTWMGVKTRTIYTTGGASANRDILQVLADMQNADVHQFETGNSAALGAALRAAHADLKASRKELPWDQIVKGFAEPVKASRVRPNKASVKVYREFLKLYKACEDHALHGGPDPRDAIKAFKAKTKK
jgi:xylulokinase